LIIIDRLYVLNDGAKVDSLREALRDKGYGPRKKKQAKISDPNEEEIAALGRGCQVTQGLGKPISTGAS